MKRKIQHNAVNNQEDEDSCAYPTCSAKVPPVEKKDGNSSGQSGEQLPDESTTDNDDLLQP